MVSGKKFVAVLTQSPALGSIISMVLDCEEHLNVQTFNRAQTLQRHTRIAPLDLIICDAHLGEISAPQLAIDLRQSNPNRCLQFIVLSEQVDQQFEQSCKFANINEVIVKPMSPLFLRDRVVARLAENQEKNLVRSNRSAFGSFAIPSTHTDNVVNLHAREKEIHPQI